MRPDELLWLFELCLDAEYTSVEESGSFCLIKNGDFLYVLFEKSNGVEDWENNLDFSAVVHTSSVTNSKMTIEPYKDMEEKWYCHGGFLRVWKSVLKHIEGALLDLDIRRIICVGYSHGAALALLCHEYLWYNRHDLRGSVFSFGFGCPRVIYGYVPREKERWADFYVIRNLDDLVTHLPPRILGYRHVGKLIEIGGYVNYSRLDAHREENYVHSLRQMSEKTSIT